MKGRFGAVTGEHEGSGQNTRTNCVGVAVTTIAAGAVGTNDGVAVQDEGSIYAFASAPFAIDGTDGGGQENGALKTGPVRTVPGGSGSDWDRASWRGPITRDTTANAAMATLQQSCWPIRLIRCPSTRPPRVKDRNS